MTPALRPPHQDTEPTLVLDPNRIVETIEELRRRIEERFPESSLGRLCGELQTIGGRTKPRLDQIERPNGWLRATTVAVVALVMGAVIATLRAVLLSSPEGGGGAFGLLQAVDSGIRTSFSLASGSRSS